MRFFARANVWIIGLVALLVLYLRAGPDRLSLPGISLPGLPFTSAEPIEKTASGGAPWSIDGYGWHLSVARTARSRSRWMGTTKPSITITAYVRRDERQDFSRMNYRISDERTGSVLDAVPFQGGGDGDPPLGQRSKLVFVVWDTSPKATHVTITLHDFYWSDGRNLVLHGVRVPAS